MKRLVFLSLLGALALGSCSSKLTLTGTAPGADNDGTCASPVLSAVAPGSPRVIHFQWSGPAAGEDSLSTTAGTAFSFTRIVPAGTYSVRCWASDAGGAGCDTVLTRTLAKSPPWRPFVQ